MTEISRTTATGSLTFSMAHDYGNDLAAGHEGHMTKRKCWGTYTRLEKCFWILLGLVVILLGLAIATTTIVGVQFAQLKRMTSELGVFSPNSTHHYPGYNQCLETSCVLTAARMKNSIDESVNPCDDFYQFACGDWIRKTSIPASSGSWEQFGIVHDELLARIKGILEENPPNEEMNYTYRNPALRYPEPLLTAQQFYEACKAHEKNDSRTTKDFSDFIKATVGIDRISNQHPPFGSVLGRLRREVSGDYIFKLFVALNETNTTHNVIYLDQPEFGLNREDLLDPSNEPIRNAYLDYITKAWALVFPNDASQSTTIAMDILQFEIALANASMGPDERRRNKSILYNPMTLEHLKNLTRDLTERGSIDIDWTSYFEQVFKLLLINYNFFGPDGVNDPNDPIHHDGNPTLIDFNNQTTYSIFADNGDSDNLIGYNLNRTFRFNLNSTLFIVRDVQFFANLSDILKSFRYTTIADYLHWRVLWDFGQDVNGHLKQLFFEFQQKTQGVLLPRPIWKNCADWTNYYFGMAISYTYVDKYIDKTLLQKAKSLVSDIIAVFHDVLREVDWLDSKTRRAAIDKAEQMKRFIGYPEWLKNVTRLEQYYYGLEFSSPEMHFYNLIDLGKWQNRKKLMEILKRKDEDLWINDPTVVDAFYYETQNSINIPAGIFQPPFYTMPLESLNYGALGAIIGHEIIHGYDPERSQHDADGNLRNWWDESTLRNYLEKAACFIEQYSNYVMPEVNKTVNGQLTLSENVADDGGVRLAFLAYKQVERNQPTRQQILPGLPQYNSDQLFFLSYAQTRCEIATPSSINQQLQLDPHSPSRFRVNGVMANSREFAETWNCALPRRNSTCKLW